MGGKILMPENLIVDWKRGRKEVSLFCYSDSVLFSLKGMGGADMRGDKRRYMKTFLKNVIAEIRNLALIILVILLVLFFQCLLGWECYKFVSYIKNDASTIFALCGQFGDMFGFVNAFFSGMAFIGLIVAIMFQKKELALQREELALTREQIEKSAKAQEDSEKALRSQAEASVIAAQLNAANILYDHFRRNLESQSDIIGMSMDEANTIQKKNFKEMGIYFLDVKKLYAELSGLKGASKENKEVKMTEM